MSRTALGGTRWKNRSYLYLGLAVGIFLIFQLFLILTVDLPEYDEAVHLNIARSIRRTGIATRPMDQGVLYTIHTPLYQYFLGLSTMVLGERLVLLRLLTLLFGLGAIFLSYGIGIRLKDDLTGFAASLLLALNPIFILYSFFLREEIPMLFFLLLAVYFLVKEGESRETRYLNWAGISIAVAILLKEFAFIFWFAAVIYVFLGGSSWSERFSRSLRIVIPSLVGFLLWITWVSAIDPGQLVPTFRRWINAAMGNEIVVHDFRYDIEPGEWLMIIGDDIIGWETLILLLVGVIFLIRDRRKQPPILFLLFAYVFLAVALSFFLSLKEPRHLIGIVPMLAIAIGYLIPWASAVSWLKAKRERLILGIGVAVVLFALGWGLSPVQIPHASAEGELEKWWEPLMVQRMFTNDRYYNVFPEVGSYLAQSTSPDEVVVIVHEGTVMAYYADRPYQFLYTKGFDQVMEILAGAEVYVFDRPSYFQLSAEEIDKVTAYIDSHFEVEKVFTDVEQDVVIYRRTESLDEQ